MPWCSFDILLLQKLLPPLYLLNTGGLHDSGFGLNKGLQTLWTVPTSVYQIDILTQCFVILYTLQWRHNEHDGIWNYQPQDCLLSRLFRHRSKEISKLCVTGLCEGNSLVTSEFPAQRTSNVENVSIWWCHHVPMWIYWINVSESWILNHCNMLHIKFSFICKELPCRLVPYIKWLIG